MWTRPVEVCAPVDEQPCRIDVAVLAGDVKQRASLQLRRVDGGLHSGLYGLLDRPVERLPQVVRAAERAGLVNWGLLVHRGSSASARR